MSSIFVSLYPFRPFVVSFLFTYCCDCAKNFERFSSFDLYQSLFVLVQTSTMEFALIDL